MDYFKLNNGIEIPQLGLGVFLANGTDAKEAVKAALKCGYRHIDTAKAYDNEDQVGEAIKESGVPREEIFLVTKMWLDDIYNEEFDEALNASLKKLQTDYLDMYLLHWTVNKEKNAKAWKAMERFAKEGKCRAIGVCNYMEQDLDNLLETAEILPAVNQIEIHPDFTQARIMAYNASKNIATESWSPLGGEGTVVEMLKNPVLVELAEKYHKAPSQVILRWHLQRNCIVIPKSIHENRIKENFDVFDFVLSDEDMAKISGLNIGKRVGPNPYDFWEFWSNTNKETLKK